MEEESKHEISILVECILYRKLKTIIDDENMPNKEKRKNIKKYIEDFVQESTNTFKEVSEQELKRYAIKQLQRVNNNIKAVER